MKGLVYTAAKNLDESIAVVIFNSNKESYELKLSLGINNYEINIGPRTQQTIHLQSN